MVPWTSPRLPGASLLPIQHVLVYQDNRLPLGEGVTVIGRALGCGIRFNTATVSRQHLKLTVAGARLLAENLSTTTGTLVNGKRMQGVLSLRSGDRVQLGPYLVLVEAEEVTSDEPILEVPDDDGDDGEVEDTRTGNDPTRIPLSMLAGSRHATAPIAAAVESHTCPRCRARIAFSENVCTACGYSWGPSHPSSITERITLPIILGVGDRAGAVAQAVPVIYTSEEMTLDVTVTDIRIKGMFIPSELLDTPATACELTILPDGHPVLTVHGIVRKVRQRADATGPAGLEIEFTEVPSDAAVWLALRTGGRNS